MQVQNLALHEPHNHELMHISRHGSETLEMARRAASGRLDQEQTIHAGCKILWAGGTLESRRDQAAIAALAPTSEKPFVFLRQPYVPFENNGWERGLLVVNQINANTPQPRWPTANKAGDTDSYAVH